MRARVYSAAAVAGILTASAGCGGDSCAPGGRTGTAPLGAACGSDCDCATTNCYQGHCLPRVAWTARYLCDTSSSADVVADTGNGLFVSGMFVGKMDVDPTDAVDKISATTLAMPFATALTRDKTFLWGETLATTPTNPVDKNPTMVLVARPAGANVVLGLGDTNSIRNAWRIDRRAVEAIITSTHRQPDLVAGRYGDARRPDLHIQLDGLAGRQWPQLVVRVIRLVRQAASGVELAV